MNEFKKIWNAMNEYTDLIARKKEHLQKEHYMDSTLEQCKNCPYIVSDYLLKLRKLNRHLADKLYNVPLYEFPVEYVEQMKIFNSVQPNLENKNEDEICKILPHISRQIEDLIIHSPHKHDQ